MTTKRIDHVRTALTFALAVALVVGGGYLLVWLLRVAFATPPVVASVGEVVPLDSEVYGTASKISLPGDDVTIRIGRPVSYVDYGDVDYSYAERRVERDDDRYVESPEKLVAADDGRLVPITVDLTTNSSGVNDEQRPLTLRLVHDEQSIVFWPPAESDDNSVGASTSYAVAVAGQPELADLRIEADYDGVVQRLDLATGEIDAGAAQALYEPRSIASTCAEGCDFSSVSPDQPLQPARVEFSASDISFYPYDSALGWAPDGTIWAATRLQVFPGEASDSSGAIYFVPPENPTRVELVGSDDEVFASSINQLAKGQEYGRVVFAVPTDVEPTALVLRQRAALRETTQRMPLQARVPLG